MFGERLQLLEQKFVLFQGRLVQAAVVLRVVLELGYGIGDRDGLRRGRIVPGASGFRIRHSLLGTRPVLGVERLAEEVFSELAFNVDRAVTPKKRGPRPLHTRIGGGVID
jgi:hypothetical protein